MASKGLIGNLLKGFAQPYRRAQGYMQIGLRHDDLIIEENDIVREALRRLPEKEAGERLFRIRRAMQMSITHTILPREQWTKPEEDVKYLTPIIEQVEKEFEEMKAFNGV